MKSSVALPRASSGRIRRRVWLHQEWTILTLVIAACARMIQQPEVGGHPIATLIQIQREAEADRCRVMELW